MTLRRRFILCSLFILLMTGSAHAHSLEGILTWTDRSQPPGPIRITIVSLKQFEPIYSSTLAPSRHPFRFKLDHLARGLYLILIHVGDTETPILHWVNLNGRDAVQKVQIHISQELLDRLKKRYESYRLFMHTVHRSPLHLAREEIIRWPAVSLTGPEYPLKSAHFSVTYLARVIPIASNRPALLHTTGWKWVQKNGPSLEWSFLGSITRGSIEQWSAQSEFNWKPLQAHQFKVHLYYERTHTRENTLRTLHQGRFAVRDIVALTDGWKLALDAGSRLWINEQGHAFFTYNLSGEIQYAPNTHHTFFLGGGTGRRSWIELIPGHPMRQFYWYQAWLQQSRHWSQWFTHQSWTRAGFRMILPPGTASLELRFQRFQGPWTHENALYTGQTTFQYRLALPLGEFGVAYALETALNPSADLLVPYPRWSRYVQPYLTLNLPSRTRVNFTYAVHIGRFQPVDDTLFESRSLDISVQQSLLLPGPMPAHCTLRFTVLNVLGDRSTTSVDPTTTPFFWVQVPRSWLWSLHAEW